MFKKKKDVAGTEEGSAEEKKEQESVEPEKVPDQDPEDGKAESNAEKSGKGLKKGKKNPKKPKPEKPKKPKTEEYVLKKNTGMKVLRIILWVMLVFIFFKGIISIFQKEDGIDEVALIISNFRQEFSDFKDENEELMSFAENFGREYLTYSIDQKDDYYSRISQYASSVVCNNTQLVDFKANATCLYINAYRKEEYAPNQYDVYVYAVVEYSRQILNEDGQTYSTETTQAETTMTVPIYSSGDGKYLVEDIPRYVTDTAVSNAVYTQSNYGGTSINDETVIDTVSTSISNFLTSYYTAEQSVIEYYLSSTADKERFRGLQGRYEFVKIDTLNCYYNADQSITAVVNFYITDTCNGALLYQEFNVLLKVDQDTGRYYILDMNTRSKNIRTEGELNVS
ncbi:MAG: conjugal transfer protein [Lachnospiraceae bacterium]